MSRSFEGQLVGTGLKFGLVVARFNEFITTRLLDGAMDALVRHSVDASDVEVAWVPGALELPLVAQKMALSGRYDAVVCLGAVIRGATPHFDYVAAETTKGIAQVSLSTGVPVIMGVITADTLEQAVERAGSKAGNKGWQAAMSAIEMANLTRALSEGRKG
ncbi:MAG: 6,7-dimethyl-8-ribityllumazine synthase [Bacillota bacterium]